MQINSLYDRNSNWKNTIKIVLANNEIKLVPNYLEDSIKISSDKKQYNPECYIFGLHSDYLLNITSEIGSYELKSLINDTIIVDPAISKIVPREVEVLFNNGKTGMLPCTIEGITDDTISYEGMHREIFANDRITSHILKIGDNSI